MSRSERVALLERDGEVPMRVQADWFSLNRSSLFNRPVPPSPEEIALKHRIDEIYTEFPFYGSRRITAQLNFDQCQVTSGGPPTRAASDLRRYDGATMSFPACKNPDAPCSPVPRHDTVVFAKL